MLHPEPKHRMLGDVVREGLEYLGQIHKTTYGLLSYGDLIHHDGWANVWQTYAGVLN